MVILKNKNMRKKFQKNAKQTEKARRGILKVVLRAAN